MSNGIKKKNARSLLIMINVFSCNSQTEIKLNVIKSNDE